MREKDAIERTAAVFGCIAALAGAEHGLGELLQGSQALPGVFFASWPNSAFFRILGGEPAMSLLPSFAASGLATIFLSLILGAWALLAAGRRKGWGILLLSLLLLATGGGFGPPLVGIFVGLAASRARRERLEGGSGLRTEALRISGAAWPWVLATSVAVWFFLMPGTLLLGHFFELSNPEGLVIGASGAAFAALFASLITAAARDRSASGQGLEMRRDPRPIPRA